MREQASRWVELEFVEGVSMLWGTPGWSKLVSRLPAFVGRLCLSSLEALARLAAYIADVAVLVGRPRPSSRTSA